jgi:hypothetical protein
MADHFPPERQKLQICRLIVYLGAAQRTGLLDWGSALQGLRESKFHRLDFGGSSSGKRFGSPGSSAVTLGIPWE